jgi:inosose dehydratase
VQNDSFYLLNETTRGVAMIRFGTVPMLWNNEDVPDVTGAVHFEQVLDEIAQAGYEGTELGASYPRNPDLLKAALSARNLTLSAAYYCPGLTDPQEAEAALDQVDGFLDFLAAVGAQTLVVAEPLSKARAAVAGRVRMGDAPTLSDDNWQTLADSLNQLGARCAARGMNLAFHNHVGTYIETANELKKLLNLTDPRLVGLCLDTGHYAYAGGNPLEVLETYLLRLRLVHLKDLDARVLGGVIAQRLNFTEALRRRVFTELGKGSVPVAQIANFLQAQGWSGWVVADQDTSFLTPLEAAKANRQALDRYFTPSSVSS